MKKQMLAAALIVALGTVAMAQEPTRQNNRQRANENTEQGERVRQMNQEQNQAHGENVSNVAQEFAGSEGTGEAVSTVARSLGEQKRQDKEARKQERREERMEKRENKQQQMRENRPAPAGERQIRQRPENRPAERPVNRPAPNQKPR